MQRYIYPIAFVCLLAFVDPAEAQRLTSTQPTVLCDTTTVTTCAPVSASTGLTVNGTVTVTDGSGALNAIVDSGTLTAVTTITNPVTVTDGSGALNVIIDSSATLTVNSHAVTNAGTFAVQAAQSGTWDEVGINDSGNSITVDAPAATPVAVRLSDGSAFVTADAAAGAAVATTPVPIGCVKDASPTQADADQDVAYVRCDADGQLIVTGAAAATQYNIGSVASATATTTMLGGIRDDALTTLADPDGDVVGMRFTSVGAAWVTSTVTDAAAGAAVTSNPVPMGCVKDATPTQADADQDVGYVRCDADGQLILAAVTVSGTVTANLSATDNAVLDDIADGIAVTVSSGTVTVTATNLDVQSGGADLATETTAAGILTSTNYAAAFGTAGTADTQVMSIQGIASMTPILATVSDGAGALNVIIDSSATLTVNAHAVTVASGGIASGAVASGAIASGAYASGSIGSGAVASGAFASGALASGSVASGAYAAGSLSAALPDPCTTRAKTYVPIDIVTATTVELANAVASEFFYICGINIVTAGANNIVIAEDDTDGCGSISAGVTGGVTAAEGWNFAANGGIALGNGIGTVAKTTTANRYLCILTSAAVQASGSIALVSAP